LGACRGRYAQPTEALRFTSPKALRRKVHYEHLVSTRRACYLRQLFVHGARATIRWVGLKHDRSSQWLRALIQRRGTNRAVVALANKHARMAWVRLATEQVYTSAHSAA
jgi:hypothetical protein